MKNNLRIVVIVVCYKTDKGTLKKLRESFIDQDIASDAIFFHDNSSQNRGYAGGINFVLKKIIDQYEYFLIANPDVELKKNTIEQLLVTIQKNKKVGIVGPKILTENGTIWSIGGILDKKRYSGGLIGYGKKNVRLDQDYALDFISGTCMLIKKNVFKTIGYFAEDYFLYYEDVDFCFRAKKAGIELVVNLNAEIIHFESSSVGKNSKIMQYYLARNHLLFVQRFASKNIQMRELFRLPKTLFEARDRHAELLGIRDYFLRRFEKHDYWS